MRANLVQKRVTDRNGRQTTVYVKPDTAVSPNTHRVSTAKQTTTASSKEAFFADSVARDEDGELLTLWHGSATEFDSFSDDYIGRGNDAWGNGHYFTTEQSIAESYGNVTRAFHVNVTNPIVVDGKENMSLNEVAIENVEHVEQILAGHPDIFRQPSDDEVMNPLGDYAPEFWDRDTHTDAEFRAMISKVARDYFADGPNYVELESFYGREHGSAFVHEVYKATGHDGVIVDFKDEESGKFVVAWFSDQMKDVDNEHPTGYANIHQ